MRELKDHIINPANDKLQVVASDEPGAGGACHRYEVAGYDADTNASLSSMEINDPAMSQLTVLFQNGPINEVGVNGVTHEVLMAIVIDRLRSFQTGPYACRENALALTHLEESLHWMQQRTLARMRRGVEGTHQA